MKMKVIVLVIMLFMPLICLSVSIADEDFVYDSKGKRDPFLSLIDRRVKLTDVELLASIDDVRVDGVILDRDRGASAIVNDSIIKIGEFVGGFKLVEVSQYEVVLLRDGQSYTIEFRDKDLDAQ